MSGEVFAAAATAASRTRARAAALRRWWTILALAGPLAVPAAVAARAAGRDGFAALVAAGLAFAAAALAGAAAAALLWRRREPLARAAAAFDAASDQDGLFVAAAFALADGPPRGLGAVVAARADRRVAGVALPAPRRFPRWCVPRVVWWLALAVAVAFAPPGPHGLLGGASPERTGDAAAGPSPSLAGVDRERPSDAADPRPALRELAALHLSAGRDVLHEGEELMSAIELVAERVVGEAVPLELVLAVADGLPSPDEGFGVGWRVARVPADWALPATPGRRTHLQPLRASLEALGMPTRGLLTFVAAARPADPAAPVRGGVVSEQLTVRFAPNLERERSEAPSRPPEAKDGGKARPAPSPEPKGDGVAKGARPELGAPEPLPEASTYASLVRPLFNEGPTVEKDVAVYERERGGDGAPPPPAPAPEAPPPPRAFERRPTAADSRPVLGPAERRAARDYFRRWQGDG